MFVLCNERVGTGCECVSETTGTVHDLMSACVCASVSAKSEWKKKKGRNKELTVSGSKGFESQFAEDCIGNEGWHDSASLQRL